jgi:hypothetical protein
VAAFTLTVRDGARVERLGFDSLEKARGALRERVESIRSEDELETVQMFRTFTPDKRVRARVEISTGRLLRRRDAGVDVMGDGRVVPFAGGVFRKHLDPPRGERYDEAVAAALRE